MDSEGNGGVRFNQPDGRIGETSYRRGEGIHLGTCYINFTREQLLELLSKSPNERIYRRAGHDCPAE